MSAKDKNLNDLFLDTLKDIYYAEKQILKALPKMAKAAHSDQLRAAFEKHHGETEGQVERLERVFELIDKPARGKTCEAIQGLLDEGKEIMEEYKGTGRRALRNLAIRHAEAMGPTARHQGRGSPAGSDPTGGEEDGRGSDVARGSFREPRGRGLKGAM